LALTPGARLGPYEVTGQIGAGGMGEVYRATDSNLKRSVAIKVLPASVAGDADRLARFQREAEVLAALNHPNIGSIYGLEKTPDFTALIMELVEGDDLSQRIARGPIPLDEALPIAKQIADALEAAHEQGIVHRDLKPANIKVRADGTVKVLDFGLAKAMDSAGGTGGSATMSPTITTPAMTQAGMILGTAAYMSPEQAKGRAADRRSDAWAFGCVVYEMLSGRRAYEGDDVSDTLAAVLRGEPDWAALPPETPAAVTALLRHCLVKDRHQRVSGLAAAQFVFAQHAALISQANSVRMASGPARGRRWGLIATVAAALSITAVLAGTLGWRLKPSLPAPPVARFPLVLPASQLFGAFARHVVAVSPDGTLIVYVANSRLFLRSIGELDLHPLIGSESALTVSTPAFSPDSRSIAYHADGVIKRIAVSGGAAVSMCQTQGSLYVGEASNPNGMTWDDTGIVFARMNSGIFRCPPNGGAPERLAEIKDGELAQGPQLLPDGSTLIFAVAKAADGSNRWDRAQIVAQSLKTGQRKTLLTGGSDPRYLPTGHLLYAFGGTIWRAPRSWAVRCRLSRACGGRSPATHRALRSSACRERERWCTCRVPSPSRMKV
jgi:serine/threonine-protein kinase